VRRIEQSTHNSADRADERAGEKEPGHGPELVARSAHGGHLELTSKYQAEDYIQHNPNVPTGRAGFVEFFSKFAKPKNPIPDKLSNPPVVMGARGDFVWLIFETERKDPRDPLKTYHSDSFDVLRIQNGKVQEHWDSAQKNTGSGLVQTGISPKPPMQWNTGNSLPKNRRRWPWPLRS
jgi:predicted SnoaL-like aldol condensation-catalyzing enzyme